MSTVTVVVAEDSYLLRAGIVALLDDEPGVSVIAQCGSLDELLQAVDSQPPDVVLTDIRMPPTHTDEGIRAAQRLRTDHPGVGVVVLSQYVEVEYALAVMEDGSQGRGYLLKERVSDISHVVSAIRTVATGGSIVDPRVVDSLMGRNVPSSSALSRLTAREADVLQRIATGLSNAAIAAELSVTDRAVEKHINSIFSKLDLPVGADMHRRVAAVLVFLSQPPRRSLGTGARAGLRGPAT